MKRRVAPKVRMNPKLDHLSDDPLVDELVSDARQLIGIVRRRSLPQERLADATSDVIFKIGRVIHADKQAA